MNTPKPTGPLSGIRVIDFGQYLAGPGAAMILADQGAEVIRVERPGGPSLPGPTNAVLNRSKRSIVLDLKSPQDLAAARDLVADADVVIENFRPGVMTRLGLGAETLMAKHPRQINHAYVTVKVRAPGSQVCATIDHVLLDTGSNGLRLVGSVLNSQSLALPSESDSQGNTVEECVSFTGGKRGDPWWPPTFSWRGRRLRRSRYK